MAPLTRIQCRAALVSRRPENAMPTRSPTGRLWRMLGTGHVLGMWDVTGRAVSRRVGRQATTEQVRAQCGPWQRDSTDPLIDATGSLIGSVQPFGGLQA